MVHPGLSAQAGFEDWQSSKLHQCLDWWQRRLTVPMLHVWLWGGCRQVWCSWGGDGSMSRGVGRTLHEGSTVVWKCEYHVTEFIQLNSFWSFYRCFTDPTQPEGINIPSIQTDSIWNELTNLFQRRVLDRVHKTHSIGATWLPPGGQRLLRQHSGEPHNWHIQESQHITHYC